MKRKEHKHKHSHTSKQHRSPHSQDREESGTEKDRKIEDCSAGGTRSSLEEGDPEDNDECGSLAKSLNRGEGRGGGRDIQQRAVVKEEQKSDENSNAENKCDRTENNECIN